MRFGGLRRMVDAENILGFLGLTHENDILETAFMINHKGLATELQRL